MLSKMWKIYQSVQCKEVKDIFISIVIMRANNPTPGIQSSSVYLVYYVFLSIKYFEFEFEFEFEL